MYNKSYYIICQHDNNSMFSILYMYIDTLYNILSHSFTAFFSMFVVTCSCCLPVFYVKMVKFNSLYPRGNRTYEDDI